MITDFQIGWLAGLLEGEGCFSYYRSCRIQLRMGDEDTVLRAACLIEEVTGICIEIKLHHPPKTEHSIMYHFSVSGDPATKIMKLIVEHMSWRRRRRIWQCLNGYIEPKPRGTSEQLLKLVKGGRS